MGNNKSKISIFLPIVFLLFGMVCLPGTLIRAEMSSGKKEIKKAARQHNNPYANAQLTTKIIPSVNKTFGYEILLDGRTFVLQPNIPALPGHEGFNTKEKAQKVADFVVKKIRNNEMPPTVTIEDLNNMGVLK